MIIAPTRELADQINQSIQQLGMKTGLKSTTIYGGVNKNPQNEVLSKGVDIVIACPGRLLDHIREKTITLSKIENALEKNERVELRDIFTLETKIQKARIARNPMTNEKININQKKSIKFKMSKEWFNNINEK